MGLILRTTKGTPLTYQEMDGNLTYLEGMSGGPSGSAFTGSFSGSFTGSYFGTASYALSASWSPSTFPYTGSAFISGSLTLTGSFKIHNAMISGGLSTYPFALGNEYSFIDSDYVQIGSNTRGANTVFTINGGAYPEIRFNNNFYAGDMRLISGVGGDYIYISNTLSVDKFTYISDRALALGCDGIFSAPSATLHIKGLTSGSNGYQLKMMNAATTSSLSIRNDGVIIQYLTGSAVTGSLLSNNEMTSYLDESNNLLIFKVKYSNGTVKSGSIALV